MSDRRVSKDQLEKALSALSDIAKSSATPSARVEQMVDGEQSASSSGGPQLFHTSGSAPSSWAGSSVANVPGAGEAHSLVELNGTDYKGQAKMMKSILQKLAKGIPLTAKESAVYSQLSKAMDKEDEEAEKGLPFEAKDKKDDEEDEEVGKSLGDYARENASVREDLNVAPFLQNWVAVQDSALRGVESRLRTSITKSLGEARHSQEQFNQALAKSLVQLSEVLQLQAQRIEQVEAAPARGPRAVTQVQAVEKSMHAAEGGSLESFSKSQITDVLLDLVKSKEATDLDVLRFDSTSKLPAHLSVAVRQRLQSR